MKSIYLLFLFTLSLTTFAQSNGKIPELGTIHKQELFMSNYEKDETAGALILDEVCSIYPSKYKKFLYTKEYYVKIKFFDNLHFDKATLEIPYYKEYKLEDIQGITYNLDDNGNVVKTPLNTEDIKEIKYTKNVKGKIFSLPKVKKGSVIEYRYKISVNSYGIYDWYFQSNIPKLKTTYAVDYRSNNTLKVRTLGYLNPKTTVRKECFKSKKCPYVVYEMNDVPAFEEEAFISNKNNYISRLSYERSYEFDPFVKKGEKREWRTIDKAIRIRYDDELDKTKFYKKKLPEQILNEPNTLTRAKKVFYYIQDYFTLDQDVDQYFYEAYKSKRGTVKQINLSLYNALKAANIDSPNFVMLSTRSNGFATKLHATVVDFNYYVVGLQIDNTFYFLDASNKFVPFGLIPSYCLNGEGRVFNSSQPSFWKPMESTAIDSEQKTIIRAKLNPEENSLVGSIKVHSKGYYAYKKRKQLALPKKEELLMDKIEEKHPYVEINKVTIKNEENKEAPLQEAYKVTFEDIISGNKYLKIANLMIGSTSLSNPFKLKERKYPVDFGYRKEESFRISIAIPDTYEIVKLPKSEAAQLADNSASYIFNIEEKNNILSINFQYNINKKIFLSHEYEAIKTFYQKMTKIQSELIEIKVKNQLK